MIGNSRIRGATASLVPLVAVILAGGVFAPDGTSLAYADDTGRMPRAVPNMRMGWGAKPKPLPAGPPSPALPRVPALPLLRAVPPTPALPRVPSFPPLPTVNAKVDCSNPTNELCKRADFLIACPTQNDLNSYCAKHLRKLAEDAYEDAKKNAQQKLKPIVAARTGSLAGPKQLAIVESFDPNDITSSGLDHSFRSQAARISFPDNPFGEEEEARSPVEPGRPVLSCEDYVYQKYYSYNRFESELTKVHNDPRKTYELAMSPQWSAVVRGDVTTFGKQLAKPAPIENHDEYATVEFQPSKLRDHDKWPRANNAFRGQAPQFYSRDANGKHAGYFGFDYPYLDAQRLPVTFNNAIFTKRGWKQKGTGGDGIAWTWAAHEEYNRELATQWIDEELKIRYMKQREVEQLSVQRADILGRYGRSLAYCVEEPKPTDGAAKGKLADLTEECKASLDDCISVALQGTASAASPSSRLSVERMCNVSVAKPCAAKTKELLGGTEANAKAWIKERQKQRLAAWDARKSEKTLFCKEVGYGRLLERPVNMDNPLKIAKYPDSGVLTKVLDRVHRELRAIDEQLVELFDHGADLSCFQAGKSPCDWSPQLFVDYLNYFRREMLQNREQDLARCRKYTQPRIPGKKGTFTYRGTFANVLGPPGSYAAKWKEYTVRLSPFEKYLQDAEGQVMNMEAEKERVKPFIQAVDNAGKKTLGYWPETHAYEGSKDFGAGYSLGGGIRLFGYTAPSDKDKDLARDGLQCNTNLQAGVIATAYVKVFGEQQSFLDAKAAATTEDAKANVDLYARVLKYDLFTPYQRSFGLRFTASNEPHDTKSVFDVSQHFTVGPIPVNVRAWATMTYGVHMGATGEIVRVCGKNDNESRMVVRAGIEPYLELDANAELSAGIPDICEVGVRGHLELLRVGLPLEGHIGVLFKSIDQIKQEKIDHPKRSDHKPAGMYLDTGTSFFFNFGSLDGYLSLYGTIDYLFDTAHFSRTILAWDGLHERVPLMDVNFDANLTAAATAAAQLGEDK